MGSNQNIFAIDPGPVQSAWVAYGHGVICNAGINPNEGVLDALKYTGGNVAIEWIECYGMAVGKDVFETMYWIGRFDQAIAQPGSMIRVPRRKVKLHLCNSMRAQDTNIRQAIIDRFPATGGGKTPQVGTKKDPGPLYGVKTHIWSALAVALTCLDELTATGE